ncbi:HAD family hydrolase [Vallitalea okinawensis]|uniref:HAD family hydrolase n=1 Tax=Vallitalea okinawensis TaxID=2078660 RepID=UPI000CFBFB1E|nr:HAD family hydrolase [Vallitalea okinawensis]
MEAIIFDMDGVIIDSEPIHYICSNKMLEPYKIELDREKYDTYIGASCKVMWEDVRQAHNLKESVEEIISKEFDIFLSYLQEGKGKIQPIEGIRSLLELLRKEGVTIGLASSSSMRNIDTVLDLFDIQDYFTVKVTGYDLERSKPDPEIFIKTAGLLNVDPKECIVIEDSKNGVTAAKRAGMKCIGYQNPNCGYQDLSHADKIVDSIKNIDIAFLKGM